jgi:DNA gyrase inhibitor GyrI
MNNTNNVSKIMNDFYERKPQNTTSQTFTVIHSEPFDTVNEDIDFYIKMCKQPQHFQTLSDDVSQLVGRIGI